MVAQFDRKDVDKAFSLQIGLIWIHGIDYAGNPKNEKARKYRDYFEFCIYYYFDLQPMAGVRKKRACLNVQKLIDRINGKQKKA